MLRLPRGAHLGAAAFETRLDVVLAGLFASILAVGATGMLSSETPGHAAVEMVPIVACLIVGRFSHVRAISTGAVTFGLAAAAAMLVHFTGGLIESHFAFFVVLPLVALLHDWRAVLGCTLLVFAHHAAVGTVRPEEVYDHPAAAENPVAWGLVHVAFALALVVVLFVHWHYAAAEQQTTRRALDGSRHSQADLVEAGQRFRPLVQNAFDAIVLVGDDRTIIYVCGGFQSVFGVDPVEYEARPVADLFSRAHPDDKGAVDDILDSVRSSGQLGVREVRIGAEHAWRWIEIVGRRLDDGVGAGYVVLNARDVTAARRSTDVLRHRALHDELTGLENRTAIVDRVDAVLTDLPASVGLLFLDVDRFKNINDSLGHSFGDRLLVAVSEMLADAVGPGQTVGRLGGDEFAIVVPGPASHDAMMDIAESIRCRFLEPVDVEDRQLTVSVSVGVAVSRAGDDAQVILRNADIAMYQAKQAGRNRIAIFDESARASNERRLVIEAELRSADLDAEMVLQYQPILDVESAQITGVEALVRWHHPTRGLLGPGEFIGAAEESGSILRLGEWVLREACRQAASWHHQYGTDMHMSVNVSARQVGQPGFADLVREVVADTGIHPSRLLLEVTESALVDDPVMASSNLAAVRALGVRAALDDYGTGYAALTYLRTLPLTHIKIDRSFTDGLGVSSEATAIVENTVSLARGLGLVVVAEGVETAEQFEMLRSFGCDLAQGYHLGRPSDAVDIEADVLVRSHGAAHGAPDVDSIMSR